MTELLPDLQCCGRVRQLPRLPAQPARVNLRGRDLTTRYRRKAVSGTRSIGVRRRNQKFLEETRQRREHPLPVLHDELGTTVVKTAKLLLPVPAPLDQPMTLNHG